MPSIETLYSQSDTPSEKIGEKHGVGLGVGLILSEKCLSAPKNGVEHTDGDTREAKECNPESPQECHETVKKDLLAADRTDGLVILEIVDPPECEKGEETEEGSREDPGGGKGDKEAPNKQERKGDLDNILAKLHPTFNPARSKRLKAKLSEVLGMGKTASKPQAGAKLEKRGEQDLSEALKSMTMKDVDAEGDGEEEEEEEETTLKARGPGMRGGMGISDLPGQYSPSYARSPNQSISISSPPHDSTATYTPIGEMKGNSFGMGDFFPQNTATYYPVSPPEQASYQSNMSDVESLYSAPSPDDGQDIPTVMASALQVIVPGQVEPTARNQMLIDSWRLNMGPPSVQSSVPSPHGVDYDNGASSRDFQEQSWPEPSPPSSLHCNPPSVGSASDADSVFSYNAALSPAGSTASMVQSPAAPQRYQKEYRTSTNSNFGIVQVNRSSTGHSPSPPEEKSEDEIQKIVEFLKSGEMTTASGFRSHPPPAYSPTEYHKPQQQQHNVIPSINAFLPPYSDGSMGPMRPTVKRGTPYQRPASDNKAMPAAVNQNCSYQEPLCVMRRQSEVCVPQIEYERFPGSADPSVCPQGPQSFTQHHQAAQTLTVEQLIERDTNDPYEGENVLQKFIFNLMPNDAIAVVHRMAQLGLDLNAVNDQGQSALLLAVIHNMPLVVMELVKQNADVLLGDNKGTYPIHYAASHGFLAVMDALCCRSGGVNLNALDFNGKTPLMCAVQAHLTEQSFYIDGEEVRRPVDNREMAWRLIKLGARVTMQDASSGKTALHFAISEMKLDMVQLILEGDHNLEVARVAMSDGNTPLHLAVALKCNEEAKCKILQYLISKGADVSAQNVEKSKPLDYVTVGHNQVKECLESFSKSSRKR